jgi:hypothetical protein
VYHKAGARTTDAPGMRLSNPAHGVRIQVGIALLLLLGGIESHAPNLNNGRGLCLTVGSSAGVICIPHTVVLRLVILLTLTN